MGTPGNDPAFRSRRTRCLTCRMQVNAQKSGDSNPPFTETYKSPQITYIGTIRTDVSVNWNRCVRLLIRGKHRHATLRPARKWGDAIYESDFLKENGVWKIQHEHSYFIYYVHAASGWDQGGGPPPGPLKDLPPDEPITFDYKLYPDVYVPPFHYKNPVT
jgi:hypothetical protein